ncbi:hypothetical protein ACFMEY_004936, partial [Escherichia coli]
IPNEKVVTVSKLVAKILRIGSGLNIVRGKKFIPEKTSNPPSKGTDMPIKAHRLILKTNPLLNSLILKKKVLIEYLTYIRHQFFNYISDMFFIIANHSKFYIIFQNNDNNTLIKKIFVRRKTPVIFIKMIN